MLIPSSEIGALHLHWINVTESHRRSFAAESVAFDAITFATLDQQTNNRPESWSQFIHTKPRASFYFIPKFLPADASLSSREFPARVTVRTRDNQSPRFTTRNKPFAAIASYYKRSRSGSLHDVLEKNISTRGWKIGFKTNGAEREELVTWRARKSNVSLYSCIIRQKEILSTKYQDINLFFSIFCRYTICEPLHNQNARISLLFSPVLRGDNRKSYHCSTRWRLEKKNLFLREKVAREIPSVLPECSCTLFGPLFYFSPSISSALVVVTSLHVQFKWQLVTRYNTSQLLREHCYANI